MDDLSEVFSMSKPIGKPCESLVWHTAGLGRIRKQVTNSVCRTVKGVPATVVLRESTRNYKVSVSPPDRCSNPAECSQPSG